MKKYLKLLLCAAVGISAFTACEDVPEPYNIPTASNTPTVPTAEYIINQTFTSSLGDFKSQSESGSLSWTNSSKYGAIITGYDDFDGDGNKENKPGVTYLISPEVDLSEVDSAYVVIEQAINYAKETLATDHYMLIRVGEGEWKELPMSLEGLGTSFTYATQNIQIPQEYMGQKIQLALKHVAHDSYSSTWEVKSLKVAKGQAPAAGGETPVEGLVGSGTKDDPYDVPSTIKLIAAGPPSTKIYTKGIVSKINEIDTGNFGNATYYISNDGSTTDQLEVYRGYGLGGAKFKSENDLKVGDEVIVYGVVVYYNNKTMEFTQGSEIYSLNGETAGGGSEPSGDAKGSGSKDDPFNVVAAIAGSGNAWVKAYIVGWIEGQKLEEGAHFNGSSTVASNLLIADSPDETNVANCMPVQLPGGSDARTALNLMDNPGNYKKEVMLYGSLEKYFGVQGIKSVSDFVIDGSSPEPQPEPGAPSGSGTLADPYNSLAANDLATALAAGAQSDKAYFIKGKIVRIKEQFGTQYGNATFFISDDGTKAGEFQVFRAYYLGNKKWVEGNAELKEGDDVIVYAKLTNYQGNTPETVQGKEGQDHGYLYSLNGVTEAGDEPGDDPGDNPGDNPGDDNKISPTRSGDQVVTFSGFSSTTLQIVNDYTGTSGGVQLRILNLEVTYANGTTEKAVMSELGLNNADALSTYTLGGLTLIFDKGEGGTQPAYYTGGGGAARMYAKNSLTITANNAITKVVVNCTAPDGSKSYNGNEQLYAVAE